MRLQFPHSGQIPISCNSTSRSSQTTHCPSSRLLPPCSVLTNFGRNSTRSIPSLRYTFLFTRCTLLLFHSLPEITFNFGFLCCASLSPQPPRLPPLDLQPSDHPFPHLGQRSSLLRFVTAPATSVTLFLTLPRIGLHFISLVRACPQPRFNSNRSCQTPTTTAFNRPIANHRQVGPSIA